MGLASFLIRRAGSGLVVIFLVSVVIFSIVRLVPGDPAYIIAGEHATEESVEAVRAQLGLDRPATEQYFEWVGGILRGDLGQSVITGQSLDTLLAQRYARTGLLAITAFAFTLIIAFPLGIIAGINRNSNKDYTAMVFSQVGLAIPSFWLGILFIIVLSVLLGLFPVSGYYPPTENLLRSLHHVFLPALTLSVVSAAIITRFVRSSILEVFNEDYIRTARAYGHPERRIVSKYVLKNALIPAVTITGLQFGFMLGGTVIIEEVFAYPGIGRLILNGILTRDYPVIQIGILALAVTFIIVNIIVDMLYSVLNPRIQL